MTALVTVTDPLFYFNECTSYTLWFSVLF